MEAPGYWDNTEESQEGMKELKNLKDEAQDYESLRGEPAQDVQIDANLSIESSTQYIL